MELAGVLVILGMAASVLMGISQKYGYSGPMGAVLGALLLPATLSLFWRSATVFGWWTIAIFIVVSLVIGFAVAPIRRTNPLALLNMQPLLGLAAVGLAVTCWWTGWL